MPMTPRPSVVRTDADGLAAFQGDALLGVPSFSVQ